MQGYFVSRSRFLESKVLVLHTRPDSEALTEFQLVICFIRDEVVRKSKRLRKPWMAVEHNV